MVLSQGFAQSLSVETDKNVLPAVKTKVIGGVLHLGFKDGTHVRGMRRLEFRITAVRIEGIAISGSGSIAVSSHADRLLVTISGSGNVTYGGGARATIRASGSGAVRQE